MAACDQTGLVSEWRIGWGDERRRFWIILMQYRYPYKCSYSYRCIYGYLYIYYILYIYILYIYMDIWCNCAIQCNTDAPGGGIWTWAFLAQQALRAGEQGLFCDIWCNFNSTGLMLVRKRCLGHDWLTVSARIIERSQEDKSTVKYRTFVLLRVPIRSGVGKFNYRTGRRTKVRYFTVLLSSWLRSIISGTDMIFTAYLYIYNL